MKVSKAEIEGLLREAEQVDFREIRKGEAGWVSGRNVGWGMLAYSKEVVQDIDRDMLFIYMEENIPLFRRVKFEKLESI